MLSDIFISYSRKDAEQAEQLAELLMSAGLSCWIDKSGIDLATSWSGEIVDAIAGCKAFVVLLSPNSVASENVVKEVSLAATNKKKILPLDLEPVELTRDIAYHLAGIQRAPMTNIDAIIRALAKLGLHATSAPSYSIVRPPPAPPARGRGEDSNLSHARGRGEKELSPSRVREGLGEGNIDERKSLMILPFEDLSPTADNAWFADGIVSEMISALSNVKALRIADNQATKEFKKYNGQLVTYAREMGIRYFVQGDVRKFGDQIKITSRLLDIETGDHLWQDSMKGTMDDIFDIQEKVAEKVVEGLKVHLAADEKKKLAERGTESAEAYELYLKAREYFLRQTKEGLRLAVQLFAEAILLDPSYAQALSFKANALASLYLNYNRLPELLDEAETLSMEAMRLRPDLFATYYALSLIYTCLGKYPEAEEAAREFIRKDPQNYYSYFTLGFFYLNTDQNDKAIAPLEESLRLRPKDPPSLWNLVVACDSAGEREKCASWATVALQYVDRHLKLHPDDEGKRVWHANLLQWSGKIEEAYTAAIRLTNVKDGVSLYNTACLFGRLGDRSEALRTFRKAIEAGFRDIRALKEFLTDENEGILTLQGTPEYEEVKRMVEGMSEPRF